MKEDDGGEGQEENKFTQMKNELNLGGNYGKGKILD